MSNIYLGPTIGEDEWIPVGPRRSRRRHPNKQAEPAALEGLTKAELRSLIATKMPDAEIPPRATKADLIEMLTG